MEYRGYDSGGVAVVGAETIKCVKAKGKVALLKEKCRTETLEGAVGIGHTRWATHGEPSERNAHPHKDCTGDIFVAHNGIIENYGELKAELQKKGHRFASETDTEVIAHLIEEYVHPHTNFRVASHCPIHGVPKNVASRAQNQKSRDRSCTCNDAKVGVGAGKETDFVQAVRSALKDLRGAFGIVVLSQKFPDGLIVARFGSPLLLGRGKGEIVVASDANAILPIADSAIHLRDSDMAVIHGDRYEISGFADKNEKRSRAPEKIEWKAEASGKNGFPHFMLKEIMEQPDALRNTMRGRLLPDEGDVKFGGIDAMDKTFRSLNRFIIVGMGTARFMGQIGEYAIEELAGIPAKVEYASEFAYKRGATDKKTGLIVISQSGETADTLNAVKEAKRRGMPTIGVINCIGSSIAEAVDAGMYNHVGPEISVASTKASTSQALLLTMLALHLGRQHSLGKAEGEKIVREMDRLPELVEKLLSTRDHIKKLATKLKKMENLYLLGRGANAASAQEGALKLKETSYIHAEGYATSELKHGPLALIDKDFPALIIAPDDRMYEKNRSSIQEIKARNGTVIAITTEGNKELEKLADHVLYIPKISELLSPILVCITFQLLAYYLAVAKGCDVDRPRNLAKSVTVE